MPQWASGTRTRFLLACLHAIHLTRWPRQMRLSRSACAQEVASRAFAMPLLNPSYPRGPHRFKDREYLIITYRTDRKTLEAAIPAPLRLPRDADPLVKWETIKMPDSQVRALAKRPRSLSLGAQGFGDYTEGGLVIPVEYERADGTLVKGSFVHSMYLDAAGPISGGREIWGESFLVGQVERVSLRCRLPQEAWPSHLHGGTGLSGGHTS